jgi:hypothetical protein
MIDIVLGINLNKDLKGLFFKWLARLEYERTHRYTPSTSYASPRISTVHQGSLSFGGDDDIEGVIYFYEWSNATAIPRTFYTLKAFENFLDRSDIYVPSYQWELIRNIHNPYVSCKKNSKELIIKTSWDALKSALEEESKDSAPFRNSTSARGSEDREPYSCAITRPPIQRPPMYTEVENRYPDMEEVNSWFG